MLYAFRMYEIMYETFNDLFYGIYGLCLKTPSSLGEVFEDYDSHLLGIEAALIAGSELLYNGILNPSRYTPERASAMIPERHNLYDFRKNLELYAKAIGKKAVLTEEYRDAEFYHYAGRTKRSAMWCHLLEAFRRTIFCKRGRKKADGRVTEAKREHYYEIYEGRLEYGPSFYLRILPMALATGQDFIEHIGTLHYKVLLARLRRFSELLAAGVIRPTEEQRERAKATRDHIEDTLRL